MDTETVLQIIEYINRQIDMINGYALNNKGGLTEAEAINRASIQAEDYYKIRKVFECELIGPHYLDIELYDVLEVELSLTKTEFIYYNIIQEVLELDNILQETLTSIDQLNIVVSPIETRQVGDEYFGTVRGQVVSRQPNYTLQTNVIKLRQRPYSLVWENIYG